VYSVKCLPPITVPSPPTAIIIKGVGFVDALGFFASLELPSLALFGGDEWW
jgi:hypothetical protein